MTRAEKSLFCFGYGYSCNFLGRALEQLPTQWELQGTTRDEERYRELKSHGVRPYLFNRHTPLPDAAYIMRNTTHLLISTPPDDDGDPSFIAHADTIKNLPNLEWIGYLSTTGVYGDRDGRSVDETAGVAPTSKRGTRRIKAEEQWLSLYKQYGLPVHIFRLAGIYGPGRCALDSVRAGIARRIHKRGHAFGRIHVEDIAGILMRSFCKPTPGEIFNVCDDLPAPSHSVIEYACDLLGQSPPPMIEFEDANLAPMTRSFYADNRRVRNHKVKDVLGLDLKYPDYKAGLQGCLDFENLTQQKSNSKADDDGKAGTAIPAIFKRN